MLTVTLLGTAATLPLPDRGLSAAVFTCQGRHILLDCGEGTQVALHRERISPMKIDLVALTHGHGDHVFGLPGLLQSMGTMERTQPLAIACPAGMEDVLVAILTLADELPFPVQPLIIGQEGILLSTLSPRWPQGARLNAFPTQHRIPSQGYCLHIPRLRRLDADKARALDIPRTLWRTLQAGESVLLDGRIILPEDTCYPPRTGIKVVFTGDTAPCPDVVQAAQGADLLITDATYGDDAQADKAALYGHSTFSQAAAIAAQAQVQRLWLTHFSAMMDEPETFLPAARALFPAAECGQDGLRTLLSYPEEM